MDVPDIDVKKTKQIGIAIVVVGVALMVGLTVAFKVPGALAALAVTLIAGGIFINDLSEKQKKVITAFKTMGFSKEEYISSLESVNPTQKKAMIALWDKVPEPEKVITIKGKAQKVGQSKQNKKKKKYTKKKKK